MKLITLPFFRTMPTHSKFLVLLARPLPTVVELQSKRYPSSMGPSTPLKCFIPPSSSNNHRLSRPLIHSMDTRIKAHPVVHHPHRSTILSNRSSG